MKKSKLVLVALIVVFFASCSLFKDSASYPKDIKISLYSSGGMLPENETIFISKDSCSYSKRNISLVQTIPFSLTNEQVSEIYSTLKMNKFNKIESESISAIDRGGTELNITIDDENYIISNLGHFSIKESYKLNFKNIESKIKTTAFLEIDKLKNKYVISIDKSILESAYDVMVYVNDKLIYYAAEDEAFTNVELKLFKQNNKFKVLFMKSGNHTYQTVMAKYELLVEDLKDSKNIFLTLVNNTLKLK